MTLILLLAAFAAFPTDVSVRDFGAKGDGVTDDSAAIQAASDQVHRFAQANMERVGTRNGCGGQGDTIMPRIVFPAGTYLLKRPVCFLRDHQLCADGEVVVKAADDEQDLFVFIGTMRHYVEGFTMVGGARQFLIETHNNESANFKARNCTFRDCKGIAVVSDSYRAPVVNAEGRTNLVTVGRYRYDKETKSCVKDARFDDPGRKGWANSTFLTLEGCRFFDCVQASRITPDGALFRDLRVTSTVTTNCVFSFVNNVRMYDVDVRLKRPDGADRLAFINGFSFNGLIEKSSFRSLDGRGIALLRHNGSCRHIGRALMLRDLDVDCGGCPEGAVVCCENRSSQEIFSITDIRDHTGRPVQALKYADGMTQSDFDANRQNKGIPSDKVYTVVIGRNSANVRDDLPPAAERYRECASDAPEAPLTLKVPRQPGGEVIRVTEPTAGALKAALEAAAKLPSAVVMLCPAKFRISETLKVRGNVTLTAAGVAMIIGEDDTKDLFEIESGSHAFFSHIFFWKGRNQFVCRAEPNSRSIVVLDCCCTFDASDTSLRMEAKGNREDLRVLVDGGVHYHAHWYDGNADATLAEAWFRLFPVKDPKERPDWCCGLVNRGRLRYQDILGVPIILTAYHGLKYCEMPQGDFRWIDNDGGELISTFSRWGGEGGGVPPVYNYRGGKVLIEGSYGYFYPGNTAHCAVVSDSERDENLKMYGVICGHEIGLWYGGVKFMHRKDGKLTPLGRQNIHCIMPKVRIEKPRDVR